MNFISGGIVNCAASACVSKMFGISTPKAMAVHSIGWSITEFALRELMTRSPDPDTELSLKIAAVWFLSHTAGQELARRVCNVDVTARDVLKMLGVEAAVIFTALVVTDMTAAGP